MTGLDIDIGGDRVQLKLPIGYTVDSLVHTKLDSPNTTVQREWVTLTIKEHGWPT